ncbi:maestro heat-like repeat-containing protein family member 9 [Pezoporus flaviventris]|uniref:maestro heat-like repeat-containing protein family member 9 n=1 Tax=Pezoporus flaviventris TaxID=889875 RepID=UPI002AB05A68|nr:maestro heat-like repeat-containing protein family member 9 [Pezoporus flaviventris]
MGVTGLMLFLSRGQAKAPASSASPQDPEPHHWSPPSTAWLCVPRSLHSQDALGDKSSLSFIPQMFTKYLQPSERSDIILMAVKTLTNPGVYSIGTAAHMVDILVTDSDFQRGQVLNITWAIYRNLPSVSTEIAGNSLKTALLMLTQKNPGEVVASMLQCSPTCSSGAMAMWKTMLSKPKAARKVLEELLRTMMNQSLRKVSATTMDNPRMLSLAACRTIHKILEQSLCPKEVEEVFPKLFLALLFQVSFTTELKQKEILICWKEYQQDQLTPIRSAVQSMRVLLRTMGFQIRELVIEEQGGWAKLLHVEHHLEGVRIVARREPLLPAPRAPRTPQHPLPWG